MNVNIKRLHPDAIIPKYATEDSAAFDLHAVEDVIIAPNETGKVPLGLAFEIPKGYAMFIVPRSGISLRTKLRQSNSIGVIDSDYRGEVAMMFDNIAEPLEIRGDVNYLAKLIDGTRLRADTHTHGKMVDRGTYIIRKGDRIAQAFIQRLPSVEFTEVTELSETERGEGGFGSTGMRDNHTEHFATPMGKERI